MARGIPRLEPDGIRSVVVRGHRPRDKTPRRYRPEAERRAAEPWRADGYGPEYRRARELCIDRARGRYRGVRECFGNSPGVDPDAGRW